MIELIKRRVVMIIVVIVIVVEMVFLEYYLMWMSLLGEFFF